MLIEPSFNIVSESNFDSIWKSFRDKLNQVEIAVAVKLCRFFRSSGLWAAASKVACNETLSIILGQEYLVALPALNRNIEIL